MEGVVVLQSEMNDSVMEATSKLVSGAVAVIFVAQGAQVQH